MPTALFSALDYLSKLGAETEALAEAFETCLGDEQNNDRLQFGEEAENTNWDKYCDKAGWNLTGWRWQYYVKRGQNGPGAPLGIGQLSLFVDFGGEGRPARSLGFPCAVVGLDFEEEMDDGTLWPGTAEAYGVRNQRLVCWKEGWPAWEAAHPATGYWFYVVPLFGITTPGDVRRLLVQPVINLLRHNPDPDPFGQAIEVCKLDIGDDGLVLHAG